VEGGGEPAATDVQREARFRRPSRLERRCTKRLLAIPHYVQPVILKKMADALRLSVTAEV
jgi:hypothetical protein